MNALLDLANGKRVFFFGYGHTHDFTPNVFEAVYLRDCACYVTGVGGTHGLDDNGRIATDSYVANMNLPGFLSHKSSTPLNQAFHLCGERSCGDTPHPGRGLRPLHPCFSSLQGKEL